MNTEKSYKCADRALRSFLEAMGKATNDCDYWDFTEESLDDYLAKFGLVHKNTFRMRKVVVIQKLEVKL